jgi:hypothetical protein
MSLTHSSTTELAPAEAHRDLVTINRVAGVAGLITVVVLLGTSLLNGYQNQGFTEGPDKVVAFFQSVDDRFGWASSWATSIGLMTMLFFTVGLALVLRAHERGLPWRTTFLGAAGVITVISGQIASWDAATFRSGTLDANVATYAFDLGNISFANSWVATGTVGILAGLVMLRAGLLPWLAWWGIVAGIGQVVARGLFRHEIAYAPFGLFWLWTLVVSVLLLAGRFVPDAP